MSLVFDNELHDMTSTGKDVLLDDEELSYLYEGDIIFEEVPYYGKRTDLVTVAIDVWAAARRKRNVGHLTPLPDERRFRKSYNSLQTLEPVSRRYWVHEDGTYHTERTCREVWDWLAEHRYLVACDPLEVGGQAQLGQTTLDGQVRGISADELSDDHPMMTVKYPDCIRVNAWELKPRDWQTALRQAARAECYAEYRWVLMDAGGFEPTHEIRKQFRDERVGLATLDADGLEVIQRPQRASPPKTQTRFMLNERAVAAMPDDLREDVEAKHEEVVEQ